MEAFRYREVGGRKGEQSMINKFKEWACRLLCKGRLFNSDMSLEVDRLVQENERLKESMNDQ